MDDIFDDFIPKDSNLVKIKNKNNRPLEKKQVKIRTEKIDSSQESPKVIISGWEGECNPFINAKEFFSFFKNVISSLKPNAKFGDYSSEAVFSAVVMDEMIDLERDNVKFLRSWIQYYVDNFLKGNKASNYRNTSLNKFRKTLKDFSSIYLS